MKKKWKGLRDSFRREYNKFLKSGQEAPDEFISSWPFFEQMLFLKNVMQPRELKGNLSPPAKEISNSQDEGSIIEEDREHFSATDTGNRSEIEPQPSSSFIQPQQMGPPTTTTTTPFKEEKNELHEKRNEHDSVGKKKTTKRKNAMTENCDAKFLKIERAKLQLFSESTSMKADSEYQFLMSLHPYLKKIPEDRQLNVRNKLLQVLIDDREHHSTIQSCQTSSYLPQCNVPFSSPGNSSWTSSSNITSPSSWPAEEQLTTTLVTLTNVSSGGLSQTEELTIQQNLQNY